MGRRLLIASMCIAVAAACDGGVGPAGDHPDATPVFGVKLEPPAGRVVHGMGQWAAYNATWLAALPADLRPASQLVFIDLGDTPRGWRPATLATQLQSDVEAGFIPHLDLALRGLQPLPADRDTLSDPYYGIDDVLADTDAYDDRIQDVIDIVKGLDSPVMIRIGGEFNGSWNGYHPWDYPRAFRKIVGMFRDAGVDNVAFSWCYMPAAPGDFDAVDAEGEYRWYPGADVIDWYGIDWFDTGDFSGALTERGEESRFGRTLRFLDMALADGRPVIVAESAPARYDLSDPADAGRAWTEWFQPYFQLMDERTEIEWFHLISYDWTQATRYQQIGWRNNDLTADPTLLERLIEELSKPKYLHGGERGLIPGG